jgi:hypothetical protein
MIGPWGAVTALPTFPKLLAPKAAVASVAIERGDWYRNLSVADFGLLVGCQGALI